jgi:hypothetical protein
VNVEALNAQRRLAHGDGSGCAVQQAMGRPEAAALFESVTLEVLHRT